MIDILEIIIVGAVILWTNDEMDSDTWKLAADEVMVDAS